VSCGVGCRCGLDLVLLRLWCRLVATAPIRPLAWEPPCAMSVALENTERQKKKKKKKGLEKIFEREVTGSGIDQTPTIDSFKSYIHDHETSFPNNKPHANLILKNCIPKPNLGISDLHLVNQMIVRPQTIGQIF